MADYLPPVVARLSMDIGDFAAKIAEAKAMMKGLNGEFKIDTSGLAAAAAKVDALKASLSGMNATVKVTTDGLGTVAAKTAAAGAAGTAMFGAWIGGFRLTANAIHWIIAGGAELLAVTLPALVALGAGLAVVMQGAQMVQQHMSALYTATEATSHMFGQTVGDALGMGHALQAAQDAANPAVYGALGSALITVKEHFGNLSAAGLQVAQTFQTFAARVAVDFAPGGALGGEMDKLLANMTKDLTGIGQVFGNLGHALLAFGSQMPGLAEVLLGSLSGVLGLSVKAIELAGSLKIAGVSALTAVMGFEEFNRWGGLLASTLTRMGVASASLSGGAVSFERFGSVVRGLMSILPTVTMQLGLFMDKVGAKAIAGGLGNAAAGMEKFVASITPLGAGIALAAAVGLGFLIDKFVTARSAIQGMTDAMQTALMKMSNTGALNASINNIAQLQAQVTSANKAMSSMPASTYATGAFAAGVAASEAASKVNDLSAGLTQQQQDLKNVVQGAAFLAKTYGTTMAGALALADEANVKLAAGITGTGEAAQVARMQIASLVTGYMAMGQSAGQVGTDMTALAIQSGLAGSQVGKLNSAWDQFQGNLTGGTAALAGLSTDLTNLSSGVNNVTTVLGKAKVTLDLKSFAGDLKSFAGDGAVAWQNFSKVVGQSAPQLLDWLRTAGTEGALSAQKFKQAGLDMASALVPLAAQSATAQAEVMGLVQQFDPAITSFSQLKAAIASSGASFSGLDSIVGGATALMANMQGVASALGNVLSSALVSAMQAAQVQASGAGAAMEKYTSDLMAGNAAAASADYSNLISDLEKLGLNAQQAAALVASVTQNLHGLNGYNAVATITVDTNYITTGSPNQISTGIPNGVRAPGHAAGTPSAPSGWAWVGEAGPELVKFRGGETVLPNQVSMGFADGAYDPGGFGGVNHIHVHLDGREIYSAVQQRSVATQRRTGHNGMTKRTR